MDTVITFAVAVLAALVYLKCLHAAIVFDGIGVIGALRPFSQARERSSLKNLVYRPNTGRAVTYWTYFRDLAVHGDPLVSVGGWHARDIALHALNAALVFALLRWWFPTLNAGLGAAFFAVHPLGASTVPSIAGRSSLLCMAFFLSTLIAFLAGWWVLIPLLAWFGWRSKEEYIAVVPTLAVVWWFA